MQYDFAAIEKKWQDNWEKTKPYAAVTGDKTRKKFYGLIEFPYPSAAGLHVGPRPFTAIDVVTRKKRMEGYNVLFPIGFDAFGLPTENFAIKNHVHPAVVTQENIKNFTRQLKMLGYGFDGSKPAIREAVAFSHHSRILKMQNRFGYLKEKYGFTFNDEERAELLALKNPGRPHFVAMMLKKGYVRTKDEGFEAFEGYHGSEPSLSPEEAIDAILRSGGIPVLAHGILADGAKKLTEEEITARVERFRAAGLMGLECYYSTFTPRQKEIMLDLADRFGLLVTAGSDYHGGNKQVMLGQTNDPDPARLQGFYDTIADRI